MRYTVMTTTNVHVAFMDLLKSESDLRAFARFCAVWPSPPTWRGIVESMVEHHAFTWASVERIAALRGRPCWSPDDRSMVDQLLDFAPQVPLVFIDRLTGDICADKDVLPFWWESLTARCVPLGTPADPQWEIARAIRTLAHNVEHAGRLAADACPTRLLAIRAVHRSQGCSLRQAKEAVDDVGIIWSEANNPAS